MKRRKFDKREFVRTVVIALICIALFYGLPYITAGVMVLAYGAGYVAVVLARNIIGVLAIIVAVNFFKKFWKNDGD